jgi:16S rRNA processing protein RimM
MKRRKISPDSDLENSGSPTTGGPEFIAVGKIRRPHGVHGELVMELLTDFPERLEPGKIVFAGEEHEPLKIEQIRPHNEGALIAFDGLMDREEVGRLRNTMIFVPTNSLPDLPEGEFYYHELFGLKAVTETGEVLGEITEVIETGANDVYVITSENGQELLLPALDETIIEIDLDRELVVVRLQDWA